MFTQPGGIIVSLSCCCRVVVMSLLCPQSQVGWFMSLSCHVIAMSTEPDGLVHVVMSLLCPQSQVGWFMLSCRCCVYRARWAGSCCHVAVMSLLCLQSQVGWFMSSCHCYVYRARWAGSCCHVVMSLLCLQSEVGWFKVGSIIVALFYVVFFALGPGEWLIVSLSVSHNVYRPRETPYDRQSIHYVSLCLSYCVSLGLYTLCVCLSYGVSLGLYTLCVSLS